MDSLEKIHKFEEKNSHPEKEEKKAFLWLWHPPSPNHILSRLDKRWKKEYLKGEHLIIVSESWQPFPKHNWQCNGLSFALWSSAQKKKRKDMQGGTKCIKFTGVSLELENGKVRHLKNILQLWGKSWNCIIFPGKQHCLKYSVEFSWVDFLLDYYRQ